MASLCMLLRSTELRGVRVGASESRNSVLTDAVVAALFSSLPSFPASLRALRVDHEVRGNRGAVASRIVAGVRSNTSLTRLVGLAFRADNGVDGSAPGGGTQVARELKFWVRSNVKGRALVEAFVRGGGAVAPPPPRGDANDGADSRAVVVASPPAGLMARVLHGCLRPSVRMNPNVVSESSEMDLPVLYHFVRQLAPVTIPRAP
jgi:hypothetical protein